MNLSSGAVAAGLLFGLSIIVAVGPQNSYVIRQGLRREHVVLVVTVCAGSDLVLIVAGTGGAGAVLEGRLWLVRAVGVVGIAFLIGYGLLAARRAWRPTTLTTAVLGATRSRAAVLGACLGFTWLNPAVYVDTVFVLAPVSQSHGDDRWWFAIGAILASAVWFAVLGFGAQALSPVFARPLAWRVLDASVAVIMLLTATRIAVTL